MFMVRLESAIRGLAVRPSRDPLLMSDTRPITTARFRVQVACYSHSRSQDRLASNDELEDLVGKYSKLIASAIRRVCARRYQYVAEDVQQEVYVAIWQQLRAGKKIDYPASYIYKVALTTALRMVRRQVRERDVAIEAEVLKEQATSLADNVEVELDKKRRLEAAISQLPEQTSRALRAYLLGFNHEEVADLLGISPSTARHTIYRGIASLKSIMQSSEENACD